MRRRPAQRAISVESPGKDGSSSIDCAEQKLAQLDQRSRKATTLNLGLPTFGDIAGRIVTAAKPSR